MTAQVRCPHCSGTERNRTARQLHEGPADPSVDLRRELLAPPPAPREPGTDPKAVWNDGSPLVAGILYALALVLPRFRQRQTGGPELDQHLANRALWTRRMQVWEFAQVCLDCRGAFFPEGVLRTDIAASPLIPLEQFPVMVVTMAERARRPVA